MSKRISKHDHRIERIAEHAAQGKQFVVLAKGVKHIGQVLLAAVNLGYAHGGGLEPEHYLQCLDAFPDDVVISFYPTTMRVCVYNHRCGCTPVDIERPKRTFQDRCDELLRKIVKSGECAAVPVTSQEHCDALFKAAIKVGLTVDPEDYWTTFNHTSRYVILYPLGSGCRAGVYNHDGGYDLYNRPKE